MKKNGIIILILSIVIIICLVIGIIFGFGLEDDLKSNKSKIINNAWSKKNHEVYLNGNKASGTDSFSEYPYINITKDQYIYCYLSIPGLLTEDNEHICQYYNYEITEEYMIVYGLHDKKEEKLYYELKDDDKTLIFKFTSGEFDIIETYRKAM